MTPREATQKIQIGLKWDYMIIANPWMNDRIMSVCPAKCAQARKTERENPELIVGVYSKRNVTAEQITEDLRFISAKQRIRNPYKMSLIRNSCNQA